MSNYPQLEASLALARDSRSIRIGLSADALRQAFLENLFFGMGRHPRSATLNDFYTALALTVRDRLLDRGVHTLRAYAQKDVRAVAYLSAEFLPGPHLANNLVNLGIQEEVRQAMTSLGLDLDQLIEQEEEPGLGNGGLGRLAACFLDSLATLQVPAVGYGIRYEFGIFDQAIRDGWQVEVTDKWLRSGNPWEILRSDLTFEVQFGGRTESWIDEQKRYRVRWIPTHVVRGVAYDTPIIGYGVETCNRLRLWKAEAVESFDVGAFDHGDYYRAVHEKVISENITKVLYPNDEPLQGKQLRLEQQYFFVSCSLQDMLRLHRLQGRPLDQFHKKFAVQLNDTHPAIAIAELMRLLVDEHQMDWATAWEVTQHTFAYTNHTLLPEALERWPVRIFAERLPRHLEIIYEINQRFLAQVRTRHPGDEARVQRMSLIDEEGERSIRMAHLAVVGSHAVNGVARLHAELLQRELLPEFHELWPERFHSITNGVTPRRFLLVNNPALAHLITSHLGARWATHLEDLRRLEPFADDAGFQKLWRQVKLENKRGLARLLAELTQVAVNPETLFDVQAKRIHEYKRQHLNLLHIVALYRRLKANPRQVLPPRTFVFAGKAAPAYAMAKLIIKLIHSVAEVVNLDPDVNGRLKVVFFPDYNVKNAQHIFHAADLSEQISTAGKEASGTGNMKFGLNGALTIGTLDGANVELREAVGAENFFLFGHTLHELRALRARGYQPAEYYESNRELHGVLDLINAGTFSRGDRELFRPLVDQLLDHDPFMVLADFQSYLECQERVSELWRDPAAWTRRSILSVARMGYFSSDRAIREYCARIWRVEPAPVPSA